MLHYFSDVKYKNEAVLAEAFRLTVASLLHDKEPPVKVEAAIAVQMMLSSKGESARKYLEPQIREITLELLKIIRETENDDLTSVMQKIVCTYTEQLVPVAVDICQHLVGTFAQVGDFVIRFQPPENLARNHLWAVGSREAESKFGPSSLLSIVDLRKLRLNTIYRNIWPLPFKVANKFVSRLPIFLTRCLSRRTPETRRR